MLGAKGCGNLLLRLDLEVQRERTEAQLVSKRSSTLCSEVTGNLCGTRGNFSIHRRRGDDLAIQNHCEVIPIRLAVVLPALGVIAQIVKTL